MFAPHSIMKHFPFFVFFAVLAALALLAGCTANQMARQYGGTQTIDLPAGEHLVNVTWKDNDLWYLTEKAPTGHVPETFQFKEKSAYGVYEGVIVVKEH